MDKSDAYRTHSCFRVPVFGAAEQLTVHDDALLRCLHRQFPMPLLLLLPLRREKSIELDAG